MPRRAKMDNDLQRDLKGSELKSLLRKAHLPADYPDLSYRDKWKARESVLTGWFEPDSPHILVTRLNNFLAAFFLWVEFYIKPAQLNKGIYYFDDPGFKYSMVRQVMGPSRDEDEPTKTIVQATRRTGKTQTLIIELLPFLVINRPYTTVLVSEFNDTRTKEEMKKIKVQIEQNERIESDFGGEGILYPKSRDTEPWSTGHLQLLRHPFSEILGHSFGSAQRGRGPLFGVIDDPETEETTFNRDWRRDFFDKLFNVYCSMFHFGGKFVWIGTPIHNSSCLSQAMRGVSEKKEADEESLENKWSDWDRCMYPVIYRDKAGHWQSHQPQRISVEAFLKKRARNPFSVAAEILCQPVTPGNRLFNYDPVAHGFAEIESQGKRYMVDYRTGEWKPWAEFINELRCFGAIDMADGESEDSDPGALVFIGIDAHGTVFVLDCVFGRIILEKLIVLLFELGETWNCEAVAGERTAMQICINRGVRDYSERRRTKTWNTAQFLEVENTKKNKVRRIMTMIPLFRGHEIRLRNFDSVTDQEGRTLHHVPFEREESYRELIAQVAEITDEGIRGPDDAVDALEMAFRISEGCRGEIIETEEEHPMDKGLASFRKIGLNLPLERVPVAGRSPKIVAELEKRAEAGIDRKSRSGIGYVPYL